MKILADLIEKFDRHCILYSAGIGIVLNLLFGPEINVVAAAAAFGTLGGISWYALKAVFITTNTVVNWECDHPGEPMFISGEGCLTEYDRSMAKAIGEATAAAAVRERARHE